MSAEWTFCWAVPKELELQVCWVWHQFENCIDWSNFSQAGQSQNWPSNLSCMFCAKNFLNCSGQNQSQSILARCFWQKRKWRCKIFLLGKLTTTIVLKFLIAILANHPKIQTRMKKEIDHVLREAEPRLEDRDMLPYVNTVSSARTRGTTLSGISTMRHITSKWLTHLKKNAIFKGRFACDGVKTKTKQQFAASICLTPLAVLLTCVVVFRRNCVFCRCSTSSSAMWPDRLSWDFTWRWRRENWEGT